MNRNVIVTKNAPGAVGPYNQGMRFSGTLVFTAGQIPIDPVTGKIDGTTVAEQTEQVLKNLSAVLEAGGASLATVIKTTVFMKDLSHFAEMNAVYARYFPQDPPARSTIEVARLPMDALVEIECLALAE